MTIRQIRSFIAAADDESFSKAASRSYISTTAFVQQINLLEKNLGFRLFNRTNRGVRLSQAGCNFYPEAQEILRIYDRACAAGRIIESKENDVIRIAYPEEGYPEFFYSALNKFKDAYPSVETAVIPLSYNDHMQAILDGIVDISIIEEPKSPYLSNLTFIPLTRDTYSFCMSSRNPLAKHTFLTAEDITDARLICGYYPYMKMNTEKVLSAYCKNITTLDSEFDNAIILDTVYTDNILVIHSLWKKTYESMLVSVNSTIDAGRTGAIFRNDNPAHINRLIDALLAIFRAEKWQSV